MNKQIHQEHVDRFSGPLKEILLAELEAGNSIAETSCHNWSKGGDWTMVFLEQPFLTPIRRDLPGISYFDLKDPHYWHSEYRDEANKLALCCKFN